jgi:DUF1680 family protein
MIRNHVAETDAAALAALFADRKHDPERLWHETEFWGKYMHSAVPLWSYSGDARLGGRIAAGVRELLSHQEPCGYLGNYGEEVRCGMGWDVWGMKYTMMGLMHWYDATGDAEALAAASRLCDYLIGQLGPGGRAGRPLRHSGEYGGLASGSVLEPVVWLHRRTGARRFLDFAAYVVEELTRAADGPRLMEQAGVPVAERRFAGAIPDFFANEGPKWRRASAPHALTKAYEMMSCYQGLLEFAEAKRMAEGGNAGELDNLVQAAILTARNIAETEINLAGGAAAGEHWFHGADQQWRHISWQQETCVTTTWMRLCEKLLSLTGDPFWADQIEKTFCNAYLASLNWPADTFAAYTPLVGSRSPGHHHCNMHTNCCNANGPRGWLCVLNRLLTAEGDAVTVNFFMSGRARVVVPALGETAGFKFYTRYPCDGDVEIEYHGSKALRFTLKVRIPAFAEGSAVKVNGEALPPPAAGTYCAISREWCEGDRVELSLPLTVKMHRLHDHVAFTRGPVCLARDSRFGDGDVDDDIRADRIGGGLLSSFTRVKAPDPSMMLAVAAPLPAGSHTEDPDNGVLPDVVRFTDYASAGNLWTPGNRYRVWLPELIPGRNY